MLVTGTDIFGTLATGTETVCWILLACTGVSHTTYETRPRLIQAHTNILANYETTKPSRQTKRKIFIGN